MIPEEEYGTWGWMRDPGTHYCRVCDEMDTFEHDVIVEKDMSGQVTLTYCADSSKILDDSANRDITQAEFDYVKKSLGVQS